MIVRCPKCKKRLRIPGTLAGKQVQCPKCSITFVAITAKTKKEVPCRIEKTKRGYLSRYDCPSCKCGLRSNEDEMGQLIPCPDCGKYFVVPGKPQVDEFEAARRRKEEEARRQEELQRQQQREAEARRRQQEREERREQERIRAEIASRPFDFPIEFHVDRNGTLQYRDSYFEANNLRLRVNPDLDIADGKLAIKSIRLFKKYVNREKREITQSIRDTKEHFRRNKPTMHKSRRKGFISGVVNIGIEISRESHAANLENALRPLEVRKEMCNEVLLACDQLIHEVDILMAENE